MPLFHRFNHGSRACHITDVENLYGALRDGNHGATLKGCLSILNGAVNGPHVARSAIGTEATIPTGEHQWTPADEEKSQKLAGEMAKMIGLKVDEQGNRVMEGAAVETETDDHPKGRGKTAKARREATEAAEAAETASDTDAFAPEPNARFEGGVVGAVPWSLIQQLVALVIQYLMSRE